MGLFCSTRIGKQYVFRQFFSVNWIFSPIAWRVSNYENHSIFKRSPKCQVQLLRYSTVCQSSKNANFCQIARVHLHISQLHVVISAQAKEQSQFASISHKRDVNSHLAKAASFFVQPYKPGRHPNTGDLLCEFHQAECCAHFSPGDQADEATGGLFKQTTYLFASLL